MNWQEIRIDKDESQRIFDDYCASKSIDCPTKCKELRDDICNLFAETLSELQIGPEMISKKNYSYQVDYIFGLRLYQLLNDKYEMSIRAASSAEIWRYLSVRVVPDVVEMRYGIDHPDRFWEKPKRLWLRVLWWYIYLSWQGSAEATIAVLKDNSTDEIAQLVDRCGRGGYRVELYREIMRQHGQLDPTERRQSEIFRKIMVLNTARVQAIEPGLVLGGEKQYVTDLCDYFSDN